jgi:hypothetical protein
MTISDEIARFRSRFPRFLSDCLAGQASKDRRRDYMRRYMSGVYRKDHRSRSIILTAAEDRRIVKAARQAGRKPAAFIREAALAYLDKRYLVPEHLEAALHVLTYQLSAFGNNLNQIARHVNTRRSASDEELSAARSLLEHTEDLITAFVRNPPEAPQPSPSHLPDGDQIHEP